MSLPPKCHLRSPFLIRKEKDKEWEVVGAGPGSKGEGKEGKRTNGWESPVMKWHARGLRRGFRRIYLKIQPVVSWNLERK